MRTGLKALARAAALVAVFPLALLAGFGRVQVLFVMGGQWLALVPGKFGSYLRVAYYKLTLEHVGPDCHIAFGSFFAHPESSMGTHVGIGAYCVVGHVTIGDGSMLATHSQVLSGARQHVRDEDGTLTDDGQTLKRITIGKNCWVGAGAVVMADLGDDVNVSPGSVVAHRARSGSVVVGNPAMPVRFRPEPKRT